MALTEFVAYYTIPIHQSGETKLYATQALAQQEKRIQDFLKAYPEGSLIKTFIESSDHFRSQHQWPQLEKALAYCLEHSANLVIAEIGNLTQNDSFCEHIIRFTEAKPLALFCCDQHYINRENFKGIWEHAKQQRLMHGQLIRAGLSRSSARSGNPHALDAIKKVNKPKIENAILFALLLQPIISVYQAKEMPQRKMVQRLNEEGFSAPEGGHWVLSQLQKVLDRIKLNQIALDFEETFDAYQKQGLTSADMANKLKEMGKPNPWKEEWTVDHVYKIQERISRLQDIMRFSALTLALAPILEKYHIDELTDVLLTKELQQIGVLAPSTQTSH